MWTTLRDLLRYSPSFRYGAIILVLALVLVGLSFVSPYEPDDRRAVERNEPPSAEYWFGTTSQGQDVFWMLTYAVRNTLIIAGLAVMIGRGIAVIHRPRLERRRPRPGAPALGRGVGGLAARRDGDGSLS